MGVPSSRSRDCHSQFATVHASGSPLPSWRSRAWRSLESFEDLNRQAREAPGGRCGVSQPNSARVDGLLVSAHEPTRTGFIVCSSSTDNWEGFRFKQQASRSLWVVALLSISVFLAACSTGEAPKKQLTESDYKLEMSGQVPAGEFDSSSIFWVWLITKISPDLSRTLDWHKPGVPIAGDGSYKITVDARQMTGPAIDPKLFGEWYLFPTGAEVEDISVSDPGAKIRVINSIAVYHKETAEGDLKATHSLNFWERQVVGGKLIAEWKRPVFSDRDVSIQGSVGAPASTLRATVDLNLKAGWNFVYATPGSRGSATIAFVAQPVLATDVPELTPVAP